MSKARSLSAPIPTNCGPTRVLGLGQNELERGLVEILKRRDDRKSADEFRYQAIFEQVLRSDFAEDLALLSATAFLVLCLFEPAFRAINFAGGRAVV
jgi:hypothetical protein